MSNPPDDALPCVRSVIAKAYETRDEGITFRARFDAPKREEVDDGRLVMTLADGAPAELEFAADASTAFPRLIYLLLGTYAGAEVVHKTKKIGPVVKDIFEAEMIATIVASQEAGYARLFLRAMGETIDAPTRIITDSLSGARVINNVQSAGRSRPFLWRSAVIQDMCAKGEIRVLHVPDADNPADFLTKWVSTVKVRASTRYTSGACHAHDGE